MACGGFSCSKNALAALNILYILVSFILIGVAAYGRVKSGVTNVPIIGGIIACGVFLLLIAIIGLVGALKHHQVCLFFYMIILFLLFLMQFVIAVACLALSQDQQYKLVKEGWKYLIILFILFLLQFVTSVVTLAISSSSSTKFRMAELGWSVIDVDTKSSIQQKFQCCGFTDETQNIGVNNASANGLGHPSCENSVKQCQGAKYICCNPDNINTTTGGDKDCGAAGHTIPSCYQQIQEQLGAGIRIAGGVGLFFSFTEIIGVWLAIRFRNQKDPRANPGAFL